MDKLKIDFQIDSKEENKMIKVRNMVVNMDTKKQLIKTTNKDNLKEIIYTKVDKVRKAPHKAEWVMDYYKIENDEVVKRGIEELWSAETNDYYWGLTSKEDKELMKKVDRIIMLYKLSKESN